MTAPLRPSVLLFDLDGTLTDPALGITRCIQHAFSELDMAIPPDKALMSWIGPPLRSSFVPHVGEERADRAVSLYRERFAETGLYENELIEGMADLVKALQKAGQRCYVATSKPHVYASRIVEHFGLSEGFEAVYGSELDGTRTDKTHLLAHLLTETGHNPADCMMIGDRKHDIIGAQSNNITSVGVLWGYGSLEELQHSGADRIVSTPAELHTVLNSGDTQ